MIKKRPILLIFLFLVFSLPLFLPFLQVKSEAASLGDSYVFFERMKVGTSTGMIIMFTPLSNFNDLGENRVLRIYFPKGEVGNDKWCLVDGQALSVSGVSGSVVDTTNWTIGASLPGTLLATCYQGGAGEMDYIEVSGIGNLVSGVSYGLEIGENETVFKTGLNTGNNLISLQILEGFNTASISFGASLLADDQVLVEALVADSSTITCTVGNNVSLGTLFLGGAYVTGSHDLGTSSAGFGFYWAVRGEGDGAEAGLYKPDVTNYLLSSESISGVVSLLDGEGFGLVMSSASDGNVQHDYNPVNLGVGQFGAVNREASLLLQTDTEVIEASYVVTLGARAGIGAQSGVYTETLTYICGGYVGTAAPEVQMNSCDNETTAVLHGETYNIVAIGEQCWMAQNLNYDDGCSLVTWVNYSDVGWCGCYINNPSNCSNYGRLYQWSSAMNGSTTEGAQGICPVGWHLPTDANLKALEMELGMSQIDADATGWRNSGSVGEQLKTASWGGTNGSGFTALAAGNRIEDGVFSGLGGGSNFWSSSPSEISAWARPLGSAQIGVGRELANKAAAYSVRCVKD